MQSLFIVTGIVIKGVTRGWPGNGIYIIWNKETKLGWDRSVILTVLFNCLDQWLASFFAFFERSSV
jgi:hypothetical protein